MYHTHSYIYIEKQTLSEDKETSGKDEQILLINTSTNSRKSVLSVSQSLSLSLYIYIYISWMRLFAFHIALNLLGNIWIQLSYSSFFLFCYGNQSRRKKTLIQTSSIPLKNDLMLHIAHTKADVYMCMCVFGLVVLMAYQPLLVI